MAKYEITKPRFLDGVYVDASPDQPAIVDVEIPEGREPDPGLRPVGTGAEQLEPHYVGKQGGGARMAADVFSAPEPTKKNGGKRAEEPKPRGRPSDQGPV